MACMCAVSKLQILTLLPFMLGGDALRYYSTTMKECVEHEDAIRVLNKCYSSDKKHAHILTAWKTMSLTNFHGRNPEALRSLRVQDSFSKTHAPLYPETMRHEHEEVYTRHQLFTYQMHAFFKNIVCIWFGWGRE